jgi:hypothetical protein
MIARHIVLTDPLLVRAYRCAINAYPPVFRTTFGDSMVADFRDALHDVQQQGAPQSRSTLLAQVTRDLVWSVIVQWARTSVPWLTMAYALALVGFCEALASTLLGRPFKLAFVLMLLPAVSAITFTFWFLLPQARQRRSSPPCLKSAA